MRAESQGDGLPGINSRTAWYSFSEVVRRALVAQWIERIPAEDEAEGSSPSKRTYLNAPICNPLHILGSARVARELHLDGWSVRVRNPRVGSLFPASYLSI